MLIPARENIVLIRDLGQGEKSVQVEGIFSSKYRCPANPL
jgi:hypothetical protein